MSVWGRIFAAGYDHVMSGPEKATLRDAPRGADPSSHRSGAGDRRRHRRQPSLYEGAETLTLTEPDRPMVRRLERRLRERSPGALLLRAPAEDLPFEDDSFDVAVSTLVLCTVDDQPRALRELRRVLKPAGCLLFIEHVRSDDPRLARWQDRLNGLQQRIGHGCNCNRSTLEAIGAAGFSVTRLERDVLAKAPPIVRPLV